MNTFNYRAFTRIHYTLKLIHLYVRAKVGYFPSELLSIPGESYSGYTVAVS